MPSANGISVPGGQLTIPYSTITKADFDLVITGGVPVPPLRLGWGWVFARQNAAPNLRWILWNGPIYRPGVYQLFPSDFGFTNFQYSLFVNWNVGGIPFTITI